eukprot:g5279.t1
MTLLVALIALALAAPASAAPASAKKHDAWQPLRDQLDAYVLTQNFAVAVGNATHGNVFTYTHGNFSMDTPVETASTSKWPVAMMLAGAVADGSISSLDARVSDYLTWWTKDPKDPRSLVTYRHLLSFTSGFGGGQPGQEGNSTHSCLDDGDGDFVACVHQIYKNVSLIGKPGEVFSYNSNHLQIAGAVAMAATGLTGIQQVVSKYLLKPYGMTATSCGEGGSNPELAVCLRTTGRDYERFLAATTRSGTRGHSGALPASIVRASEENYTPFLDDYQTLYGSYGFGHFLECYDSPTGFTAACKAARVHCDPGAFGFYPLIDRANGFYMEIVAFEAGKKFYPRSGIPEYLRFLVKPIVDAIMKGEPDVDSKAGHHYVPFNGLGLADVNYIVGCYVNPGSCA